MSTIFLLFLALLITSSTAENYFNKQRLESTVVCVNDSTCKENSFCFIDKIPPGICKCRNEYELQDAGEKYECWKVVKLGEQCTNKFQCERKAGPMAVCDDVICRCNGTVAHEWDGFCYESRLLNDPCRLRENCILDNNQLGFCDLGRCGCPLNYHPLPSRRQCVKSINTGGACDYDEQCQGTIKAVCKDSSCSCEVGYHLSNNGSHCLKDAWEFGDMCEENEQCSMHLRESICKDKICQCENFHHAYHHSCYRTVLLGDDCNRVGECVHHGNHTHNVSCIQGICVCLHGVDSSTGDCGNKNNSINKVGEVLIVFGFLLLKYIIS